MTGTAPVRVEHQSTASILTLARPEKLNAINIELLEALDRCLDEVLDRPESRGIVLTGEGKAFAAGADIAAMKGLTAGQARDFAELGHRVLARLETLPLPVVAAVNGFALGGGTELALACDFIYAAHNAKFGQPEVKLGIIPGFGGTQRLQRRVGAALARELIFTGRTLGADEALTIGLVNAVFDAELLVPRVTDIIASLSGTGREAIAHAKRVIAAGGDLPLADGNRIEIDAFADCFRREEAQEGIAAFLEKRAPKF